MEKVATGLSGVYGDEFGKVSGDIWNILIDKAEMEAFDKIKMVPKGQGVVAYGNCTVGSLGGDAHAPGPAQPGGRVGTADAAI